MGFLNRFTGFIGFAAAFAAVNATAALAIDLEADLTKFIRDRGHTGAGISVVLVQNGRPPEYYSFGKRGPELTKPVDSKTLFQIASMSKAFTATLGLLLDAEGALDIDRPVQAWHPSQPLFALKHPTASREATLEDLLSHRTGVLPHNELWSAQRLSRSQIYARLPRLAYDTRADYGFREPLAYRYSNIMVMAAGHAMELKTGQSWESMVEQKLFAPIGMTSSVTTTREFMAVENKALGRSPGETGFTPIDMTNIGPAASISSNAEDMGRWLDFLIHSGQTSSGRVVLGSSQFARMIEPFTRIPKAGSEYFSGLGWRIDTTYGKKVVWHTGHINHTSTFISFIPARRIGVAVLTDMGPDRGVTSYFALEVGFHIFRVLGQITADERYGPHDRGAFFY